MNKDKELNLEDLIREASYITGFTQKDIKTVANALNLVIEEGMAQGYSIKNHKLFKIYLENKEGYTAYNGFKDEYYEIPDKQVIKFKPLSRLENSLDKVNNPEDIEEK